MAAAVRLGLVGVGRWGRRYAETIPRLPGIQLSAVTTSKPHDGLFPPGCDVFASWPAMLDRAASDGAALDGVVLAVPPQLHRRIAVACVERRLPVLVEKPMATTLADAEAIDETASRARVPVMVDHTHLFSPAFGRMRQLVGPGPFQILGEGGDHGPVGRPVPPLWDWGPHDVAMCLALTGALPDSVRARQSGAAPNGGVRIDLSLRFGRGDTAELTIGNGLDRKRRLLRVEDRTQTLVYDDLATHKLTRHHAGGIETVDIEAQRPLDRVVEEFAAIIRSGADRHDSAGLGVDVVRVLVAADESLGQAATDSHRPSHL
jgi:predicted dehydrogenase